MRFWRQSCWVPEDHTARAGSAWLGALRVGELPPPQWLKPTSSPAQPRHTMSDLRARRTVTLAVNYMSDPGASPAPRQDRTRAALSAQPHSGAKPWLTHCSEPSREAGRTDGSIYAARRSDSSSPL